MAVSKPESTRRKILEAAFSEFYQHGFQGGSLNHIVNAAGATKGAVFHHFAGKLELGYAVVDEIIGPLLKQRWLDPLRDSVDPITDLKQAFRQFITADMDSGAWLRGCPLNNLAQEMPDLDEGFRRRIDALYTEWRKCVAAALARGVKAGTVRKRIAPRTTAAMIVAAQMGIWGTAKSSQDENVVMQATGAMCAYLDSLKP